MYVEVREQFCALGFLIPPLHGLQEANSGCQAYVPTALPTDPSCQQPVLIYF